LRPASERVTEWPTTGLIRSEQLTSGQLRQYEECR